MNEPSCHPERRRSLPAGRQGSSSHLVVFLIAILCLVSCTTHKIDSQLKMAEELIGTRKFEEAVRQYKSIINRYPRNSKTAIAYLKIGDLHRYTFSNDKEALDAYSRVIEGWPLSSEAYDAHVKRVEIYKTQDKMRKVIDENEVLLANFPDHQDRFKTRLQIAEAYFYLYDPYQASVELEVILKDGEAPGEIRAKALFDLGESYLFLEKYDEALKSFEAVVKEFPEVPHVIDAQLRMVECLEKLDKPDEALQLQEKLLKDYPDSEIIRKKVESLQKRGEKAEKPD